MKHILCISLMAFCVLPAFAKEKEEPNTPPATQPDGNGELDKDPAPKAIFDKETLVLIKRLQKNPWANWPTGTEIVRHFVDDSKPKQNLRAYVQPDLIYKVTERDRLLIRTQRVKGNPVRQDFRIQNHPGVAIPHISGKGVASELVVDGANVKCLLYESALTESLANGAVVRTVTKQWVLSSHPTVLLRRSGPGQWTITSVRAKKHIGKKEYLCIETKARLSPPNAHVVTTQYLHPDVPGHLVEEIKEFYKVIKGKREPAPWLITHEKTSAIRHSNIPTSAPATQPAAASAPVSTQPVKVDLGRKNLKITDRKFDSA